MVATNPTDPRSAVTDPTGEFVDTVVSGLVHSLGTLGVALPPETVRAQLDLDGGVEGRSHARQELKVRESDHRGDDEPDARGVRVADDADEGEQ